MKAKILYVEDNVASALLNKQALIDEGHQVVQVFTGDQALQTAATDEFDPVVMDYPESPALDSAATARELVRLYNWPVVFLIDRADRALVKKTSQISNYGCVLKGASGFQLEQTVDTALRLHAKLIRVEGEGAAVRSIVSSWS